MLRATKDSIDVAPLYSRSSCNQVPAAQAPTEGVVGKPRALKQVSETLLRLPEMGGNRPEDLCGPAICISWSYSNVDLDNYQVCTYCTKVLYLGYGRQNRPQAEFD